MKKGMILLVVALLVGGAAFVFQARESGSNVPGSAAEKTKNSFAQAFELMKHIQSNSLQAWEISDAEFQLLKSQHTQSIDRMLRNLGQQVSESGEVLDQNANPSCLRCSDNVKLEEAVGTDEFDDYYNFARKTPEVFYNGNATYAGVDDFLQKKGVPLADQPAIRKIMESINFITHDARLRIRFIRWFFEYAKNRVLRLDHYEVISHESHPVVGQPFALSIHAIGNHGQIMTDHHGEVTMFVVGDDDAKFPLKEIHLSQGVAHLTPRNIASGEVVIQGGVTLSHANGPVRIIVKDTQGVDGELTIMASDSYAWRITETFIDGDNTGTPVVGANQDFDIQFSMQANVPVDFITDHHEGQLTKLSLSGSTDFEEGVCDTSTNIDHNALYKIENVISNDTSTTLKVRGGPFVCSKKTPATSIELKFDAFNGQHIKISFPFGVGEIPTLCDLVPDLPNCNNYQEYSQSSADDFEGKVVLYFYESENADHNILDHHIRNHAGDIPDDVLILKVNLSSHDDLKELHEVTSSQTFVQIDNQGGLLKKWHGGSTLNDVLKEIEPETSSREEILVIGEASAFPSRLLIGDTTGNVLGRWYIYSLEGDVQVTDMYFHNETTNDTLSDGLIGIYKLMIDGELVDTAHSLNGELAFNLGRVPQGIIGGDSDIEVELVADFDDVDDDVKTGALYQAKLYSLEVESKATGENLEADQIEEAQEGDDADPEGIGVTMNKHQLVRTQPQLTTVSVGTNLDDGTEEEIYAVKIAADSKDDVSIYQLVFETILSDVADGDAGLGIEDYHLADSAGGLDGYTCVGVNETNGGGNTAVTADDGATRHELITCTYTQDDMLTINAGSSSTIYLRADVYSSSGDDRIVTSMKESYTDFGTPDTAQNVDNTGFSAIIWSDNSGVNESLTDTHWFGDESVKGLNTAAITLEG